MERRFTDIVKTEPFSIGDAASAVRFDSAALKEFLCPIIQFDHVRMRSAGFPPHPHAGFCVFSYIFEDSRGSLRDRDSLNRELIVAPGDLLWFQMGRGLIHEENPLVDGDEVHQFQVFVNLSREKQGIEPKTFHIKAADVPERTDSGGNRVRVVVGGHDGMVSPLTPPEPFTLLDLFPATAIYVEAPEGWSGLVYGVSGTIALEVGGETVVVNAGEAVGVREGATVRVAGSGHALFMARPHLDQPVLIQGMYVMTRQEDIDAAKRRFHKGEFGEVEPYARLLHPDRPYVPAGQDPNLSVAAVVERQATIRHYDEGWWKLHFQYCRYEFSDGETARGYRFVWEDPAGREALYREAGYIPYMEYVAELLAIASREGWGNIPYRDSF